MGTCDTKDRYQGCLMGGAAGDALGYEVEFLTWREIRARYGPDGIRHYEKKNGVARISDDTQMTLFTADGLLHAREPGDPASCAASIAACCRDWLVTQRERFPFNGPHTSRLLQIPELFHARAPGNTCLSALGSGKIGSIQTPINQSKGCGGIMRVAPIGLFFAHPDTAGLLAAEAAAQTHGHELGYLPAGILAWCISTLSHQGEAALPETVRGGLAWAKAAFPHAVHGPALEALVERAIALGEKGTGEDRKAIASLGEGWVAEETLAIAVYCAIRYANDMQKALCAAVNHSGDSDSTGAVTGNLLGASLGLKKIPAGLQDGLELKGVILELADQLHAHSRLG